MRVRWIAATVAVILAFADAAWAQSPRDTYVRQQQQDRFLQTVEQLNDTQILFLHPRGSGFRDFLKSNASPPTRTTMRLCDQISGALNEQYLSSVGATREQWSSSFRHMLGNMFKVPVVFVDPSKCDIQSLSNADGMAVVGTQAKSLLNGLARDGRLMDNQTLPRVDFYRVGDTVELVSRAIVEAARRATEDRRRREAEEDARRAALAAEQVEHAMAELERRAKAGDHDAAVKGLELARSLGNRLKVITFRVLSAETGPASLQFAVARDLLDGTNGLPRDMVGGRQLLDKAVAAGHVPSMVALSDLESRPNLYSDSNRRSYELLERAIALGDSTAGEKLKQLKERVSQNEWERTEKRIMEFAPWAGLALVLGVSGFVAYLRRDDIRRSLASLATLLRQASIDIDERVSRHRNMFAAGIVVLVISSLIAVYGDLGVRLSSTSAPAGSSIPTTSPVQDRGFDIGACVTRCNDSVLQCMANRPGPWCTEPQKQCHDACTTANECQLRRANHPRETWPSYCR